MSKSTTTDHARLLADDFVDGGMNEIAAQILVAALNLFAEKGYAATSVREIVREAEVTNPMLYYYFESKRGVFVALMEHLVDSQAQSVEQKAAVEDTLEGHLHAIARLHFDTCRRAPQVVRFIYSVMFGPLRSRPSFDISDTFDELEEQVERVVLRAIDDGKFVPCDGFDAAFLANQFMGMLNHKMMCVLTDYEQAESSAQAEAAFDEHLGDEALDKMLALFFRGSGVLEE